MSFIGQITNINQNMHIPTYLYAEQVASEKFADEFAKISAQEKEEKVRKIREIEKSNQIDENSTKDEYREFSKQTLRHIDIKG